MSNFLSSLPPPLTLLRPVPLVMGVALTLHGVNVNFNPVSALTLFGLAPAPYKDTPLVPIMASRNLIIGLNSILLWYLKLDVAAGSILILGSIAPVVDYYVAEKWGRKGSGISHLIGAVLNTALGAALIYYAKK